MVSHNDRQGSFARVPLLLTKVLKLLCRFRRRDKYISEIMKILNLVLSNNKLVIFRLYFFVSYVLIKLNKIYDKLKSPFFLFVLIPLLCFSFYQTVNVIPIYESRAKLIVQQPDGMATMDSSMLLLSGFGVSVPGITDVVRISQRIHIFWKICWIIWWKKQT